MEHQKGDDYVRSLAEFIRNNEKGLAEAGFTRRRRSPQHPSATFSFANPLTWFYYDSTTQSASKPIKSVVLSTDLHHLFYVLMRQEELGYDVGTLDVEVDNPSRPTSYIMLEEKDRSDTLSLASFRSSLSAVSNLSLGVGWWSRPEVTDINSELKYIFSSFTKLPALSICGPSKKMIVETLSDMPSKNALPLDAFKNLQSLECTDIDPRLLLGWDRLAEGLRSLKIKRSGLEDVADLFIGAVVDDQARRAGSSSRKRRRNIPHHSGKQFTLQPSQLPDTVFEVEEDGEASETTSPFPSTRLSSLKWAFLRHLSLADNALTAIPQEVFPCLISLSHLDLSSNLFVSIPAGLGALHNLIHLNLADNIIDSVLGIYLNIGHVLHINLSSNRLESICGLERLQGLERVDLRCNHIEQSAEIGRLATLPNIREVWIEGNHFCEIEENYRVICFDYFWKERKLISLDGSPPGFYEKSRLTAPPPEQMTSSRPLSTTSSPPIVAVTHNHLQSHSVDSIPSGNAAAAASATPDTSNPSPNLLPAPAVGMKGPRKKMRIVDLDGKNSEGGSKGIMHSRYRSLDLSKEVRRDKIKSAPVVESEQKWNQVGTVNLKELSTPRATSPTAPESPFSSDMPAKSRQVTTDFDSLSRCHQTEIPQVMSLAENASRLAVGDPELGRNRAALSSCSSPRRLLSLSDEGEEILSSAEAYRRRLEALKKDMGEGWLQIYSQTEVPLPSS